MSCAPVDTTAARASVFASLHLPGWDSSALSGAEVWDVEQEHRPGEERVAASLEVGHRIVDIHQLEERSLL